MLKVSSTKWLLDNIRYKSNNRNDDFSDLPFDFDKRFFARQQLYHINYIIVFSYINGSNVYVKRIKCKKNKRLVQCIDISTIKKFHERTEIFKDWTVLLKFYLLS